MNKKILFQLSTVGILVTTSPGLIFAHTASNERTGANSDNRASIEQTTSLTSETDNQATINTDFNLIGSTGGNSTSGNTGDGRITSGDIASQVELEAIANQQSTDAATVVNSDTSSITLSNSDTGANSNNVASATVTNSQTISQVNTADITNEIRLAASTGGNVANANTGDGIIQSGDIRAKVSIVNEANVKVPKPKPTPGGPGNEGPGGPGPGPGGEVPEVPTPPVSNGGVTPPTEVPLPPTGAGGGELPPIEEAVPLALAFPSEELIPFAEAISLPEAGVGGGFFPAGTNALYPLLGLLLLSFGLAYNDRLKTLLTSRSNPLLH